MQTLVSTKFQVVIPKEVRKKLQVKAGQRMNVSINGEKIVLSPSKTNRKKDWKWPQDYYKNLKNPWEGEDPEKYLEGERNSWDD